MASGGYPGAYTSGKPISGIERAEATVFHAGTKCEGEKVVTAGGRVLGVTALAGDLAAARAKAYAAVETIHFEGAQFRRDIAVKGLTA
jgi:phosphoribosylamine--glycine ligase